MKKILRIARIELNLLFYSPIAWLIMVIFLVVTAVSFLDTLENWLVRLRINFFIIRPNWSFTDFMFDFWPIVSSAYLIVPLMTMGLIAREVSSGTSKLLYSSPVSVRDIVIGKFIAMLAMNAVIVGAVGLYLFSASAVFAHADYPLLLSRLFAVYLLLGAYCAVGLFMSSLTSYQVVAAISSAVVLALLNFIGDIGGDIEWARPLIFFFDVKRHLSHTIDGLITTKDLGYFLIIISVFLSFTFYKLQAVRTTVPFAQQLFRYAFTVVCAVAVGYIIGLPRLTGYWDVTSRKTQTVTPVTQQLLAQMKDAPLEINSYINILDEETYGRCAPQDREDDVERWSHYVRFRPDIKFTYTYYYDSVYNNPRFYKAFPHQTLKQIAQTVTKARKQDFSQVKSPEQIHKIVDLHNELGRYCMQIKYKGNSFFLRVYDDFETYPLEQQIATAFKFVLSKDRQPRFAFVSGQHERDLTKIDAPALGAQKLVTNRYSLVNYGFLLDTLNLDQGDIPTGITGLVIADPRINFSPKAQKKVQDYIDQGGNLIIAGEPDKQDIINLLVKQFGVQLQPGVLLQTYKKNPRVNTDYPPDVISAHLTPMATVLHPLLRDPLVDSTGVAMVGVTGLTYQHEESFHVEPLVTTDRQWTWHRNSRPVLDSAAIKFAPEHGDQMGSFPTMVRLTRKIAGKQQRIIISADADWLSNANNGGILPNANGMLVLASFSWLADNTFPPDVSRPAAKDQEIKYLQVAHLKTLRILFIGVIPALVLLISGIFLKRRRQK